jgi:hypothetical protein
MIIIMSNKLVVQRHNKQIIKDEMSKLEVYDDDLPFFACVVCE